MSKAFHLPKKIRDYMEYQFSEYDNMLNLISNPPPLTIPPKILHAINTTIAIENVLKCCSKKMNEFALRALIRPEGSAEQVALSMGIPMGRGRAWKAQITYALAASVGIIPQKFTQSMVNEYPCASRIYGIWAGMLHRCYCSGASGYENYGGRGISVCNEWRESFFEFENWAKENGYQENLTIDRIDNDGNYEPPNCRWVTRKQQQNNRRNNVIVVVRGERMTVAEASDKYGIDRSSAYKRIRNGWSGDEMVEGKREE